MTGKTGRRKGVSPAAQGGRTTGVGGWLLAVATPVVLYLYYAEHVPSWRSLGTAPEMGAGASASMLREGMAAVGCLAVFVLGALALGTLVGERFVPRLARRGERMLVHQGLGLAGLGLIAFAAGELALLGPITSWVVVLLPLAIAGARAARQLARGRGLPRSTRGERAPADQGPLAPTGHLDREDSLLATAAALLCAIFLAVTLLTHLAPLTANDALVYHLNNPRLYLQTGSSAPLPWNTYSRMPHYMELLYTLAAGMGPEPTARLVDWWMGILCLATCFVLARRIASGRAPWLATALFAGVPLASDARAVGNIDLGQACFFGLALLAGILSRKAEGGDRGQYALLAGVFLGFAAGMRYTGAGLAVAWFVAWIAAGFQPGNGNREKRQDGRRWREALIAAAAALAVFFPWLLRGELRSGNPIYPLAWRWFGGEEWAPELSARLLAWQRSMGMGRSGLDTLLLPWNVTIHGHTGSAYRFFDGVVGPFFLLLLPFWALGPRRRIAEDRFLLGAILVGSGLWALGPQQIRFALPLLIPAACLAGASLSPAAGGPAGAAQAGWRGLVRTAPYLVLMAGFLEVAALASRTVRDAGPVLAGTESKENYLARKIPSYEAMAAANRMLPADARLLLIWENRAYYLERPYLADSFFEASHFMAMVGKQASAEDLAEWTHERGLTHVLYNDFLGRHFQDNTPYPTERMALLARFAAAHLEPLGAGGGIGLFAIRPPAESPPARDGSSAHQLAPEGARPRSQEPE